MRCFHITPDVLRHELLYPIKPGHCFDDANREATFCTSYYSSFGTAKNDPMMMYWCTDFGQRSCIWRRECTKNRWKGQPQFTPSRQWSESRRMTCWERRFITRRVAFDLLFLTSWRRWCSTCCLKSFGDTLDAQMASYFKNHVAAVNL